MRDSVSMEAAWEAQEAEALAQFAAAGIPLLETSVAPNASGCQSCKYHALDENGVGIDGGSASALWSFYEDGNIHPVAIAPVARTE